MRSLIVGSVLFLVLAGAARPVAAQTIADQPAATLLLPYFEVDLSHPSGNTTIFTINNASATATVGHVTVWSDLGYPVLGFDVYLTGYDMHAIDMRSILNGNLPSTADAGADPGNLVSKQGPLSQDINFPGSTGPCGSQATVATYAQLSAEMVAHIRDSLTGNPSAILGNRCAGLKYPGPDLVARGYVTVDTVNQCNLLFPSNPGYFINGGAGVATNQNVLWGDGYLVNRTGTVGEGSPLVHIRAAAADPETSVPGEYTFYGRHVAYVASDNREALGATFAARYTSGGTFDDGTYLTVWRDPKAAVGIGSFSCSGAKPSWYPLSQESLVAFDEQENPTDLGTNIPFGAATQRVKVGSAELPVPSASGWLYLGLNTTVAGALNPPEDPAAAQAWVGVSFGAAGRFSAGLPAIMLDSAMQATHVILPVP